MRRGVAADGRGALRRAVLPRRSPRECRNSLQFERRERAPGRRVSRTAGAEAARGSRAVARVSSDMSVELGAGRGGVVGRAAQSLSAAMTIAPTAIRAPTNQVGMVDRSSDRSDLSSDRRITGSALVAAPSLTALPIADAIRLRLLGGDRGGAQVARDGEGVARHGGGVRSGGRGCRASGWGAGQLTYFAPAIVANALVASDIGKLFPHLTFPVPFTPPTLGAGGWHNHYDHGTVRSFRVVGGSGKAKPEYNAGRLP